MISQNAKGFTLIELMIVVALIGILAAVAIPSFLKYMQDSKHAEAHNTLSVVATGALGYYSTEHAADSIGLSYYTAIYPGCESAGILKMPEPCDNVSNYSEEHIVGRRISPEDENLTINVPPWTRLNFSVNKPFLYVISYSSDTTVGSSSFVATAEASLKEVDDSILKIQGTSGSHGGIIGNIIVVK